MSDDYQLNFGYICKKCIMVMICSNQIVPFIYSNSNQRKNETVFISLMSYSRKCKNCEKHFNKVNEKDFDICGECQKKFKLCKMCGKKEVKNKFSSRCGED